MLFTVYVCRQNFIQLFRKRINEKGNVKPNVDIEDQMQIGEGWDMIPETHESQSFSFV